MRIAKCLLESLSAYSQSRKFQSHKNSGELDDAFERRAWRERMHVTEDGRVFIPPMAFKNAIADAAKYEPTQIPTKGKQTYTKHFESGIIIPEGITLDILAKDVKCEWLYVHADGVRGSGRRVDRCFPVIDHWEGELDIIVIDDIVDKDIFEKFLKLSGQVIGIGRFRPQNRGYKGRFAIRAIDWRKEL